MHTQPSISLSVNRITRNDVTSKIRVTRSLRKAPMRKRITVQHTSVRRLHFDEERDEGECECRVVDKHARSTGLMG